MNSGFKNENEIIEALNGKKYQELNDNLKKLIQVSFKNIEGIIICFKPKGQVKSDMQISIGDETHTYSIKKGTGNSVHQEPIESFLIFLENFKIDDKIKNAIRLFIWGDNTLDGKGNKEDRISASKFKKENTEVIEQIQKFFDSITEKLIRRFIIEGTQNSGSAEYIYYGNVEHGDCVNAENLLRFAVKNKSKGAISVGKLSFQAWNRNQNGGNKSEHKRGVIQLKWGDIKNDIKKVSQNKIGTEQGTIAEQDFVMILNKKENLEYWKTIGLNHENHFAIRVTTKKISKINKKLVSCKSDIFIASGEIEIEEIRKKNYFLNEKDFEKYGLCYLEGFGISIKKEDSYRYTIAKINPSSFKQIFGSTILGAGSSIYCQNENEFIKNTELLKGWLVTEKEFTNYFEKELNIKIVSITNNNSKEILTQIKEYSNKAIEKLIREKEQIADYIFFGKDSFEEPFNANWIFSNGILQKNYIIPFSITTGSGRSKGDYTIVVKPS